MTTAGADRRSKEQGGDEDGKQLNPIEGLLEIGRTVPSEETRAVLAKLPKDYFERFRHYAYAPPWEREPDGE